PSFYFRFVRARKGDVAGAHLDKHYWELKDAKEHVVGPDFKAAQRWKLWIPLMGCNQSNMLRVMPKSHNVDIPFDIRSVAGEMKPQIEESWLKFNEHNFVCPFQNTNEAMLFHDELAHLAPVNPGPFARISAELTIFTSERLEVKAEPLSIPTAHSIG
ncbi:MAG: hypothetical protein O3A84_14570, partial [Proteobacteria bacterium]|nr:hypothetical protein [Pseudomonadota bacterium]